MPTKNKEVKRRNDKKFKEQHPDYYKNYQNTHKKEIAHKIRLANVKRVYNLDAHDYLEMINNQNNKCAICKKEETCRTLTGDIRPLCVDHDHRTGKVRALLCNHCNAMLGHAQDTSEILLAAVDYLKSFGD